MTTSSVTADTTAGRIRGIRHDGVSAFLGVHLGATLVWVVHPLDRMIHAYNSQGGIHLFTEADVLTAEQVLPEFRLPMAELFQLPTPA